MQIGDISCLNLLTDIQADQYCELIKNNLDQGGFGYCPITIITI